MNNYNNYHKHSHYTGVFMVDSNVKPIDYAKRCVELENENIFTTEHGYGGDIFNYKEVADKYGLHCKFGIEGYIVENSDPSLKDNRNYHIMLIPKTNEARKKLNRANSRANEEGFYYRPRLFLEDLINDFDDDLYITTACVAGICKDDDSINNILIPLWEKHKNNVFLEVQAHNVEIQKELNKKILELKNKLGIKLIAATDSHYIYPEQKYERAELFKGKDITYGDEDEFILDYPSYDTFYNRFIEQGILSESDIKDALKNTLIFDECEDIYIDKSVKMPTIYPNLSENEKVELLKKEINNGFKNVVKVDEIPKENRQKYIDEIQKEMQTIVDTEEVHSVDYFLLNKKILDKAINEYGGTLTRSGRGSCASFEINRMLGITYIDMLNMDLPIYSERFMSTARLIENKSMPDIDYNIAEQEPFVRATRDLLGEHQCYPMIAYGTMQLSEAFRNVCRSANIEYSLYNKMTQHLDEYREDKFWGKYIKEAEKYVGTIISASVHPCSHLVANFDIRDELGVIKVGDFLCVPMTSTEADDWKYLKEDFLIVTVVKIIKSVFNEIGEDVLSIHELLKKTKDDGRVWDLFKDGITCTLNQVDSNIGTEYARKYQPRNIEELAMLVAAIRPAFDAFRADFLDRKPFKSGSDDLDNLMYQTKGYTLFQENLLKFFEWLGVSPAISIGLIKKIAKKKIKPKDFQDLEETLHKNWIKQVGNDDKFDDIWSDMQHQMSYGFNVGHGYATACDALYGAYLKVNYPLEYYAIVLNFYQDDKERTLRLIQELNYFGVKYVGSPKFRVSGDKYTYDKSTNTIYKGIGSIKNIGKTCGDNLYSLRDNHYDTFMELLSDIYNSPKGKLADRTELKILIRIDFFSEFGDMQKLELYFNIFDKYYKRRIFKKAEIENGDFPFPLVDIKENCEKETEKQFSGVDTIKLLTDFEKNVTLNSQPTTELRRLTYEIAYLGFTERIVDNLKDDIRVVIGVEVNKYGTPFATLYTLCKGVTGTYKLNKYWYKEYPIDSGDIIRVAFKDKHKIRKDDNDNWIELEETENIIENYFIKRKFVD